ncbi:hypothetical protein [Spongorhabdus nitratireducens]
MPYNPDYEWAVLLGRSLVKKAISKLDDDEAEGSKEVTESFLQEEALNKLRALLPSSNLKNKEFSIRDDLGFENSRNPCADIVIFNPWEDPENKNVYTIAEIKRSYERSSNKKEIIQDIARLAVLAKRRNVSTYLFLCGRDTNISRLFKTSVNEFISQDSSSPTIQFEGNVLSKDLDTIYIDALNKAGVQKVKTKLLQPFSLDGYSSYVWRVQTQQDEEIRDKINYWVYESKI